MECTPELRPLVDWLEARERVEPCPAELLPADVRATMESTLGPADTYIVILGEWVIPYSDPHKVVIYRCGTYADDLIGMTWPEVRKRIKPKGGWSAESPTLERERANFKRFGIPDEITDEALPREFP